MLLSTLNADTINPSLLNIKESKLGWYDVTWKVPVKNNRSLDLSMHLPESLEIIGTPTQRVEPGALIETSRYKAAKSSILGEKVYVKGMKATQSQVLLRIELKDGAVFSKILKAEEAEFIIPQKASKLAVAYEYWKMGTIHILEGSDHLLFVFSLLLIVIGLKSLIQAVTAFTLAHSITLVLTTLGVISLPSAPTEAIISLSIMFLASEIIQKYRGKSPLTERYPWVVAFIFGLFHGLGFAGALAEIGIPQHEIPIALLMFNVGVETGQLIFIAGALLIITVLRRVLPENLRVETGKVVPYVIGAVAAFWTIERIVAFLPMSA
jgi:hydrogenase/urease accessory protein HupE